MDKRGKIKLGIIMLLVLIGIFSAYFVFAGAIEESIDDKVKDRDYINDLRTIDTIHLSNDELGEDLAFKSYDSSTKEILIEDKDYKPIIKMMLTSPYVVSGLIASSDTKVAEFYLEDWKDGTNLIDTINFYDVNDNYNPIDKTFRFKWGNETEECFDIPKQNESAKEQECFNHTFWTEFETLDELPHKNLKISLWANTEALEKIEWVPTIEGFEILQWAEWDITSAVYKNNCSTLPFESLPWAVSFKTDGTKMYIAGEDNYTIHQYSLSPPWNLTTCIYDNKWKYVGDKNEYPQGLDFSTDGNSFYIISGFSDGIMNQYNMSTPWDVSTAFWIWSSEDLEPQGDSSIKWKPDGTKLYTNDQTNSSVNQWNCSIAWLLSSCTWEGSFSTQTIESGPVSSAFKSDGSEIYVAGRVTDLVLQYDCSTPWNVSTCNYSNISVSVASPDVDQRELYFQQDGSAFYIVGMEHDAVYKWLIFTPTINPNVIINTPLPQTYNTKIIVFNVTAVDEIAMKDCNYTLNAGITNYTMSNSSTSPTYWTATNSTMSEGGHKVRYHCWDTLGNLNNSESVSFNVDSIAPNTTTPILNSTDGTNKSNQDLNCYATLTDDSQTDLTAYWKWYKNNVSNLSGSTSVQNGNFSIITTLDAENTTKGDNWICEVTPYDGFNNGTAKNSSSITILNSIPTHDDPTLTTSSGKNFSYEDLTCTAQNVYDADNDTVVSIYNWYKDSEPLTILNMPFEGGSNSSYTKDYSGYENNDGIVNSNAVWKSSGGYDCKGAYDLTLNGATITIPHKVEINPSDEITVMAWLKYDDIYCDSNYGGSAARPIAKGQNQAFELQTYEWLGNCTARFCINSTCPNLGMTSGTAKGNWAHITGSFNGTHINTYFNGNLDTSLAYSGKIPFITDDLIIGDWTSNFGRGFIGIIDEVMIFDYALSAEQIKTLYEGKTNLIVSQETTGGDEWMCQVTPNDGEEDGEMLNSSKLEVLWEIEFDVTSGEQYNPQLDGVNINCNYSEFNQEGDTTNTYGPYGFPPGNWECSFGRTNYFDKTIVFSAEDRTVPVLMSFSGGLTYEEHTWLDWLYTCWNSGNCWNLLQNINQTTTQTWERIIGTNIAVITQEDVLSYELSNSSNISINYTIDVPYKPEVPVNELLPIRMYFWFTDVNKTQCYSQDKAIDTNRAESSYCLPLVAQILGPNDGSVNFQVDLSPNLPPGIYNFTRSIEIDPLGVWTQYGREDIGQIEILDSGDASIDVSDENLINSPVSSSGSDTSDSDSSENTNKESTSKIQEETKSNTDEEEETEDNEKSSAGITGGVIGTIQNLFSGWKFVVIVGMFIGLFVVFIISRTIIKLKKK